jgi:hypothetical protein
MYTLKQGVAIYMTAEIDKMLVVICSVFRAFKLPVVITSGLDGPHRELSLHSRFRAFDMRKNFDDSLLRDIWKHNRLTILSFINDKFKMLEYPVTILEEEDHLHIEWSEQ